MLNVSNCVRSLSLSLSLSPSLSLSLSLSPLFLTDFAQSRCFTPTGKGKHTCKRLEKWSKGQRAVHEFHRIHVASHWDKRAVLKRLTRGAVRGQMLAGPLARAAGAAHPSCLRRVRGRKGSRFRPFLRLVQGHKVLSIFRWKCPLVATLSARP